MVVVVGLHPVHHNPERAVLTDDGHLEETRIREVISTLLLKYFWGFYRKLNTNHALKDSLQIP